MDLFIKTRTLDAINPGRGLVLASRTPITNTMAELYSISRYIQPEAMEARGVSSFDAWAATFGQTDTALEQQPDGSYKQVSRFAKFVNTPELSLMVRQQMDVVTGADLEKYVTRPAIKCGKRNVVVVEASSEAKAYQQGLAARMEAIANRKGPVSKGDDILLSVINDGRLAAIDMRLVDPDATGAGSKLEAMVQKVYRTWKEGAETPFYGVKPEGGYTDKPVMTGPGTQIVFSTLGVNPSKHNPGFSVHRFIRSELIRMGVPAGDIIVADDINSHAKRQRAFNDMNEGTKRILIGSKTLFTGVNAQRRLAAIHNLDPLWYPADDEQRNGRGIRQGNMNREIEINDYTTKGTYDATMWQMMGRKASFIEAFYRGDPSIREMEDLGEASQYEQAKAMTTADPRVQVLADLRNERDTLNRRKGAAASQRRRLEQDIRNADRTAELYEAEVKVWGAAAAKVTDTKGDAFTASIGKETFDKRAEAGIALIELAEGALADPETEKVQTVAQIGGLGVELHVSHAAMLVDYKVRATPDAAIEAGFSADPVGLVRRIEGAVQSVAETPAKLRAEVDRQRKKSEDATAAIARLKAFAQQSELDEVTAKVDALEAELLADSAAKATPPSEEPAKEMREIGEPVATLTGVELGPWEDIRQLGKKAEAWYRDNLSGKTVTNAETGWSIGFTNRAAKKIGSRKGDDLFRMVPALLEIVRQGRVVASEPDSKGRPEVKAVHKIAATVMLDGVAKDVIATIRETNEGRFHYDLGRDVSDGARYNRFQDGETAVRMSETQVRSPALEGSSVEINIDYADQQFNLLPKPILPSAFRDISVLLNQELRAAGLDGKVSGALVRNLVGAAGIPIQGRQAGSVIEVNAASSNPLGVMRHEIIHALRDTGLWGKPYGLFTAEEWRALVKAARADKDIVARVQRAYPDLDATGQTEEMVAELYRGWAEGQDTAGVVSQAMQKIAAFFRALASALRGNGLEDAAFVMDRIAGGAVGRRGDTSVNVPTVAKEARADLFANLTKTAKGNANFIAGLGQNWRSSTEWLTDAMSGEDGYNLLALVPGRALYAELGKNLSAAQAYLREQTSMDALRNAWHARSDEVAQKWMKLRRGDPEANDAFMDLMHRSTLSGIDPSKPDPWRHAMEKGAEREISRYGDSAEAWARDVMQQIENRKRAYATLKTMFDALPPEFQKMYGTVRKEYDQMGDDFEKAVLDNMENATRIALKRAERDFSKEMQRITDEGLDLAALRAVFDTNGDGKLTAADAAFGQFKVLVTNADGSTTAQTLAQLGITEINLTADATRIVLPDGSVITGQTTFTRANGTMGTVANTTLIL
jgi:Large polyvalent protein associated domain 39/Large polyvalent protein-associated domain 3